MSVVAVILAAGRSARFGPDNKLTALLHGKPLIAHALEAVGKSRCDGIVVVVAPGDEAVLLAAEGHWLTVINHEASTGIASSIRAGIAALPPAVTGALIMLADMPWIDAGIIDRLIAAFNASGGSAIVFPQTSDGTRGHPVLFPASLFPELQSLGGDTGARTIIDAYAGLASPVACDSQAILKDVDTPDDLEWA